MCKILLLVPPFFTPFAPPLGVSLLKSYLTKEGYQVKCVDLNANPFLWDTHHQYFKILSQGVGNQLDGYSLYWYILNPHMLAYVNTTNHHQINYVINILAEKYSLPITNTMAEDLSRIVEEYFSHLERVILKECQQADYDYAGTSTYSTSLASALFIYKILKRENPKITTLMGGGVFADDLAIGTENLQTLVDYYPYVDKIIIGEGELLFLKVLKGEFAGQKVIGLKDIENQTLNLQESLRPDFSDFDLSKYYHLTIEGSRSCPFACKFCSERIQWGQYRKKPATLLSEQLITLAKEYQKRTFFLGDSLINLYVDELAENLLKNQNHIFFDGYLRAELPVVKRANTCLWAKAGLYRVRLGMESASPRVLELMNKKITPDHMCECLKSLSNAGVRPTTYWVVGFPGEREEDFQQTLDFIKVNYRHIYELEAHPYYYYPTGQAISGEFACECIYPSEVSEIVKFKKYDMLNPSPSRTERVERLKRISDLSKSLGLINVYTLRELYQAEERWFSLYPTAREIYEDTYFYRKPNGKEVYSIKLSSEQEQYFTSTGCNLTYLAYQIFIKEEVNPEFLKEASEKLISYHEMLQVGFKQETGKVVQSFRSKTNHESFVSIDLQNLSDEEQQLEFRKLSMHLAKEIDLNSPPLIKIALCRLQAHTSALIIIGHRLICDPESLVILAEDLYRLYRQLTLHLPLSLKPVECLYSEVMAAGDLKSNPKSPEVEISRSDLNFTLQISIEELSIQLGELIVTPLETITFAILQVLSKLQNRPTIRLNIRHSYRYSFKNLQFTCGPLSIDTPYVFTSHAGESFKQRVLKFKKEFDEGIVLAEGLTPGPIYVNLEYMCRHAWLGADTWQSAGFIPAESNLLQSHILLQIIPVLNQTGLEFKLIYQAEGQNLAQNLAQSLDREIKEIQESGREYVKNLRFWQREFDHYQNEPLFPSPIDRELLMKEVNITDLDIDFDF